MYVIGHQFSESWVFLRVFFPHEASRVFRRKLENNPVFDEAHHAISQCAIFKISVQSFAFIAEVKVGKGFSVSASIQFDEVATFSAAGAGSGAICCHCGVITFSESLQEEHLL